METPNTPAGRLTERIMDRIRQKLGDDRLPVHFHNPVYSSVLEVLEELTREIEELTAEGKLQAVRIPGRAIREHRFADTDKYGPCPCGSGSKYKFCCYGKN
jgi:hypothetical protein